LTTFMNSCDQTVSIYPHPLCTCQRSRPGNSPSFGLRPGLVP